MNKILIALACGVAALCVAPVSAQQVQRVQYPGATPTVECAPLFVCTIELETNDTVTAIAAGDTARWIVTQVRTGDTPVILIKPKQPGIRTNLIVATADHLYYVTLVSQQSGGGGRLEFYSRGGALSVAQRVSATFSPSPSPSPSPTPLIIDQAYRLKGDFSMAPQHVYNDGVHTYLVYEKIPPELPVVVAVSPSAGDELVDFRFEDGAFVIDGVPDQLDLVLHAGTGKRGRGERRLHIYHEAGTQGGQP
jgi:type IV secretion system protein TrbG